MQVPTKMLELMQMMKYANSPQDFVIGLLQQNSNGNPLMQNLLKLAMNNDTKGIEEIVRNAAKEKGIDYDKQLQEFRNTFKF